MSRISGAEQSKLATTYSRRRMLGLGAAGAAGAVTTRAATQPAGGVAWAQQARLLLDQILDRKELLVGTFLQYPPIMYRDKDGNARGFEVELALAMGKALGVKTTFVDTDFPGLLPGIQAGKFDIIVAQMGITAERAKVIHFCKPFEAVGVVVGVPAKSPLKDAADLKAVVGSLNKPNKKIAVQLGSIAEQTKKLHFPAAQSVFIQNPLDGFLQISTGRADANLRDDVSTLNYLKQHPHAFRVVLDGRNQPYLRTVPSGGGVPRGQEEFAHWVDIFVQTWIYSGDYASTYLKDVGWEAPLAQLQPARGGI